MKAATRNRWGHRDSTMVLVAYRHGLRAAELVDLRWGSNSKQLTCTSAGSNRALPATIVCTEKSDPAILVMKAAKDGA